MKLKTKLFLYFLAVILVVTLSIGISTPILIKRHLIDTRVVELQQKGTDLIRFIRDWQEDRITYWQFGRLINNLDHFLGARIWILNEHKELILASENVHEAGQESYSPLGPPPLTNGNKSIFGSSPTESEYTTKLPLAQIEGGKTILEALNNPNLNDDAIIRHHPYYKQDMLQVAIPFNATRTTSAGTLIFFYPIQSIDDMVRTTYLYLGIAAALALIVASVLATLLAKNISAPLVSIRKSAAQMASGDYNQEIELQGPEEVQELARSFNSLAHDLNENMKELDKQERFRRDFVANVSHELRTPLTIMRGFMEALLDGVISQPEQIKKTHQTMRDETVRLSALITDLLDLSRLQSGNLTSPLEPLQLAEVLENIRLLFEQPCASKEIKFQALIAKDLPLIEGNGDRLTQLFVIFMDNALKFTYPGGSITLKLEAVADRQIVTITDTGTGITSEDLPNIWERFYKSDKSRQRNIENTQSGIGLGLSLAREIIEKHHATVSVSSTIHEGTSFRISFPSIKEETD